MTRHVSHRSLHQVRLLSARIVSSLFLRAVIKLINVVKTTVLDLRT